MHLVNIILDSFDMVVLLPWRRFVFVVKHYLKHTDLVHDLSTKVLGRKFNLKPILP